MDTVAVDLANPREYCLSSTPGEEVLLAYYYFSCICLSVSLRHTTLLIEEPLNHKHMFQSETAPLVCYFISLPHACSCSCPGFACCFFSTLAAPLGFSSIPMISSHEMVVVVELKETRSVE